MQYGQCHYPIRKNIINKYKINDKENRTIHNYACTLLKHVFKKRPKLYDRISCFFSIFGMGFSVGLLIQLITEQYQNKKKD